MGLARRTDTRSRYPDREEVRFDPGLLATRLQTDLPDVQFAYLMGSASDGIVPRYADLDVAVYFASGIRVGWDRINETMTVVEEVVGGIEVDVGILNDAGPVFCFEALKGRQLFVRPDAMEEFIRFFSMTCRKYEDYMYRVERYRRYRQELKNAAA